jgi:hypothetical protein
MASLIHIDKVTHQVVGMFTTNDPQMLNIQTPPDGAFSIVVTDDISAEIGHRLHNGEIVDFAKVKLIAGDNHGKQ